MRNGVRNAHILDGRVAHVLLLEIFTDQGIGTMLFDRETLHDRPHSSTPPALDHCPFMPVFGAPAISIERGRGTEVWDTDGKRYLDFLSGIAVVSLGHANPVIADAICRQAHTLAARQQLLHQPAGDGGGGQGQRAAARRHRPRRSDLLHQLRRRGQRVRARSWPASSAGVAATPSSARSGSFHGRTLATLAATGQPTKHEPFAPMPEGFKHVAWGDLDALRASRRRHASRRC